MPVGKSTVTRELRAVLIALVGVLMAVALGFGMLRLARGGDVEIRLGDDIYDAGQIGRISQEIADRGPIMYPDLLGRSRWIILQHLGDDPETGWLALAARPPGAPEDCNVQWQTDEAAFIDLCDGTAYPSTGEGLEQYRVKILNGHVLVDINGIWEIEAEKAKNAPTTTDGVVRSGDPRTDSPPDSPSDNPADN